MKVKIEKKNVIYLLCFFIGLFYMMHISYYLFLVIFLVTRDRHDDIVDAQKFILVMYTFSYVLFSFVMQSQSVISIMRCAFLPFLAYILGRKMDAVNRFNEIQVAVLVLSLGIIVTNMIASYGNNYNNLIIPWTQQSIHPVNMNAYDVIVISLFYYGLCMEEVKKKQYAWLLLSICATYISIVTARRTNVFLLLGITAVNFFLFYNKEKSYRILVPLFLMLCFVFLCDTSGWAYTIRNHTDTSSAAASFGARIHTWGYYIRYMFIYPFHGMAINEKYRIPYHLLSHAHNIFLDIYRLQGVITMILLMVLYGSHLADIMRMLSDRTINKKIRCFWFSASIALFLTCFTEPAYDAFFNMVVLLFFLMGNVRNLVNQRGQNYLCEE